MALSEYTTFVIRNTVPRLNLPVGLTGVIVHVYGEGDAYEIEFLDSSGKTVSVETFMASDLDLFDIQIEHQPDGSYLTHIPLLPVITFKGASEAEAKSKANEVAIQVFAEEVHDTSGFVRCGLAAIARSEADGDGIPAETVIAKLEAKVAAVRERQKSPLKYVHASSDYMQGAEDLPIQQRRTLA